MKKQINRKVKGTVLIFLLPAFLMGSYLFYNLAISIQLNISLKAKEKRAALQKNDLIATGVNQLKEINKSDVEPFRCESFKKSFNATKNSYIREFCYLSDINKKRAILDLKSMNLDILPLKTCLSKVEQSEVVHTVRGKQLSNNHLVASETCRELETGASRLAMNISIDKLLVSKLTSHKNQGQNQTQKILFSTGYIEIGELVVDVEDGDTEILIVAGGDVFVEKISSTIANSHKLKILPNSKESKSMERRVLLGVFAN